MEKALGPKVLETTNDVFDPSRGTTFVCGVCAIGQGRSVSVAVFCMSGVYRAAVNCCGQRHGGSFDHERERKWATSWAIS